MKNPDPQIIITLIICFVIAGIVVSIMSIFIRRSVKRDVELYRQRLYRLKEIKEILDKKTKDQKEVL